MHDGGGDGRTDSTHNIKCLHYVIIIIICVRADISLLPAIIIIWPYFRAHACVFVQMIFIPYIPIQLVCIIYT